MVIKVEGNVNGYNVVFQKVAGDQWQAKVPSNITGIYIVEMTAWDEAGNVDHIAKYMLMYDPVNLCAKLIPLQYTAGIIPSKYTARVFLSDYFAEVQVSCCGGD